MKKFLITATIFIVVLGVIISGIKNIIISSEIYQEGRKIVKSFKVTNNTPEIENYNDLLNSDIETNNGVKRVNLDWTLFDTGMEEILEGTPIPDGYKLILSSNDCIIISQDYIYESNNFILEGKMIEFIKNTFLPSDVKLINHKAYFEESPKTNGTDSDISEYVYKSDASNLYYKISFTYDYIEKNDKTTLNNYYSDVTIRKETMN